MNLKKAEFEEEWIQRKVNSNENELEESSKTWIFWETLQLIVSHHRLRSQDVALLADQTTGKYLAITGKYLAINGKYLTITGKYLAINCEYIAINGKYLAINGE